MTQDEALTSLIDLARPLRAGQVASLSGLAATERERLQQALPRAPVQRRRQLVQMLVDLGEDDATLDFESVLLLLIEDADPEVRRLAVEGLWEYEDRAVIAPLLQRFTTDPDTSVRAAAALGLGRFVVLNEFDAIRPSDAQKILSALRGVIDDPAQPPEVRRRAVEAAGANSEPWVREMIWRAFDDDDPLVQVSALHAMGRNGDPAWLPTLYEEMESGDPQRRFEAAGAAGSIGDDDAVPHLVDLFDDADPEVQEAAVQALGEIGGELAVEALQENMGGRDARLTAAMRAALNQALTGERLIAPDAFDADLDDDVDADDDDDEDDDDDA